MCVCMYVCTLAYVENGGVIIVNPRICMLVIRQCVVQLTHGYDEYHVHELGQSGRAGNADSKIPGQPIQPASN